MIKKILLISLCVIMIISFSGCGEKMTSSEVYLLNFKPEVSEVYEEIAKVYKNETGKNVKVVTAASGTYEEVLKEIIERDRRDKTRTLCPLVLVEDAIYINTDNLTAEQTAEKIVSYIKQER